MKIQVVGLFVLAGFMAFPVFVRGQVSEPYVVGPEYPVIQQKADYQQKVNHYCGGYFVLEAATQYGGPYLAFSYRDEKNAVGHDEIPLKDISVAIVPDPTIAGTQGLVPAGVVGLPRAAIVGQDSGQKIWVISVTEKMLQDYAACLKSVPRQTKP